MTREWHAGYYIARNVNSSPLSLRVVNSPPLNICQNTTRHSVTRKWHAGHQLYHHIYPGKVWSPGLGDCVHQELLYLEKMADRKTIPTIMSHSSYKQVLSLRLCGSHHATSCFFHPTRSVRVRVKSHASYPIRRNLNATIGFQGIKLFQNDPEHPYLLKVDHCRCLQVIVHHKGNPSTRKSIVNSLSLDFNTCSHEDVMVFL